MANAGWEYMVTVGSNPTSPPKQFMGRELSPILCRHLHLLICVMGRSEASGGLH